MAIRQKSRTPSRRTERAGRTQRPAAEGRLRTLLHLQLSQEVVDDVDTLLWLRVTAAGKSVEAIRGGKNQIYDEAVERFLARYELQPCPEVLVRKPKHPWRTLWVRASLVKRCTRIAERESATLGRVVAYALAAYVAQMMTPEHRRFRHVTGERAIGLLSSPN